MDIVLGAGMAGLGAYYADPEHVVIYEKEENAGGLCNGFTVNGFQFDQAVHLSFTENEIVREVFDQIDQHVHHPIPYSWYHNKWLQHPAQNNLFPLSVEEKIEAVKGFVRSNIKKAGGRVENNFEAWNRSCYGDYLWEKFFRPYNEKYWCIPLSELDTRWIGSRIYQPTLDEILYGSYTDKTPNTYYAKEMRYPQKGGYAAFVSKIVQEAEQKGKIYYKKRVIGIEPHEKQIILENGETIGYDRLFSSIPLPEMTEMINKMPEELKKKGKELEWTKIALVSFGIKKEHLTDKMWFYIYDRDILAARAYCPSVKALANVPEGCSSIQFEIYFHNGSAVPEEGACIENSIYALEKIGMAEKHDIMFSDFRIVKYGNVIFRKGTERKSRDIKNWLNEAGIIPIGRFGKWEYLWSDQAFLSGYNME